MSTPRSGFRRAAATSWTLAGLGIAGVAGASALAYADTVKPAEALVPADAVELPAVPDAAPVNVPAAPVVAPPAVVLPAPTADKATDYPGLHNLVVFGDGIVSGSAPEGREGFETIRTLGFKTIVSVDGAEPDRLREVLEVELTSVESGLKSAAKIWESAGGYAPTIGILGAVMGLIHVMENLSDPAKLGSGIAVAFVATIYGVGAANLIFLPVAKKLLSIIARIVTLREMLIDGLVGIAKDDERTLDITLADDFNFEALRGKTIALAAKCHGVKNKAVPELTEEFIKKIGGEEMTLETLRDEVRDAIRRRKEQARDAAKSNQVIAHLFEKVEFELPQEVGAVDVGHGDR